MKKIIVDKNEGIAEVIDHILNEPDAEIVLVVPRGSALGRSARNFHLLKREADGANRNIVIESVDETILAFAKESDIEASHPLWRGVRGTGGISDIVAKEDGAPEHRRPVEEEPEEEPAPKKHGKKGVHVTINASAKEEGEDEVMEEEEEKERAVERDEYLKDFGDDDQSESGSRRMLWGAAIVVGVIVLGFFGVSALFNRADITINFKKTPWEFQNNFVADKAAAAVNAAGSVIPAQVFTNNKNTTQLFHASSFANVSVKAHGTVTIYNAYSSAKQDLVATTRFLTSDGKIYRLVSNITVPGAQVTGGKITPSSINAAVIADQPGPDYNAGPFTHLSIPGFQGTPKADTFYGVMSAAATGGATGRTAVPTAADITAAKASTTAVLQGSLSSDLTTSYPNNFKILDGATTVQLTKLTVNTSTDANGNFSVFAEGAVQAIGFDESALKTYLLGLAQTQETNSVFSSLNLNYANVSANFAKGQVSFALTAQGTLEPAFSSDDFKASIEGKSIGDARQAILALPQLADGKISVWPLWLWSIPSNSAKVHITAN